MYEVITIWDDCKKDVEYVATEKEAEKIYYGYGYMNTLFRSYGELTKEEFDGIETKTYQTPEYRKAIDIGLEAFIKMSNDYCKTDIDEAELLYDELGYTYDDIKGYKDKSVLDWFVRAIDYDDLWARYLMDNGMWDDTVNKMDQDIVQDILCDFGEHYTMEEFLCEYMDRHFHKYGREFDEFK